MKLKETKNNKIRSKSNKKKIIFISLRELIESYRINNLIIWFVLMLMLMDQNFFLRFKLIC